MFENDRHWSVLDEETYKELTGLIDPNFLRQGIRAARLARVEYTGFTGRIMRFHVPTKHGGFENYIRFMEWYDVAPDTSMDANERARLLVWAGNVQLHCTCPSFLFWGYQYILTQYDASLVPQERFPKIRNPQLKGIVCKHLNRTLKAFPFHIGDIAREIKNQFGGKGENDKRG
jgi:hypothetical protein